MPINDITCVRCGEELHDVCTPFMSLGEQAVLNYSCPKCGGARWQKARVSLAADMSMRWELKCRGTERPPGFCNRGPGGKGAAPK